MFLNVNYFFFLLYNVYIIFLTFMFSLRINMYAFNWYDIYSRIWLNEFYLNIYYYWWTSFWYIPFFLLTVLLFKLTNRLLRLHYLIYFFLFIYIYFFFSLHTYWLLNTIDYTFAIQLENVNNLLVNSINKYHPFLLYWGGLYIMYYQFILLEKFYKNVYYFRNVCNKYIYLPQNTQSFIVLLFTLGLGGWWALQEGSWGGWWNWDASEVFGLVILTALIFTLHYTYNKVSEIYKQFMVYILVLITLVIYYFIQFNFNLISHNFDLQINDWISNLNQYLFIISFIIVHSFVIFFTVRWKLVSIQLLNTLIILNQPRAVYFIPIFFSILSTIYIYEVFYSFIPLWNDFIWKFLSVNVSNQVVTFNKYNISLVVILLMVTWNILIFYTVFFFTNYFYYTNYLLIFSFMNIRRFFFLHTLIIIYIWISLLSYNYITQIWYFNLFSISQVYVYLYTIVSLDNISLQLVTTHNDFNNLFFFWNLIINDTVSELITFGYYWTSDYLIQVLVLGNKHFWLYINTIDYTSFNFLLLFALLFIFLLVYLFIFVSIIY